MPGGRIIGFTGPMFSRKTKEMVVELERTFWRKRNFLVFAPIVDDRSDRSIEKIIANSLEVKHEDVKNLVLRVSAQEEVEEAINGKKLEVVAFDEAQFFGDWIVGLVKRISWEMNIDVIFSGLDMDYQRKGFGPMPDLLTLADEVRKLKAVCFKCGERASFTQRISGGEEQVVVEGRGKNKAKYEARCGSCFHEYKAS